MFRTEERRPICDVNGRLRVISLFSFLFAAAALPSSSSVVIDVVFFFFVESVVVVECSARVPWLQKAHRHVAVYIRECTSSSSCYVSCSATRSHLVLAIRAVRACVVPLVQNARCAIAVLRVVLLVLLAVFRTCFFVMH